MVWPITIVVMVVGWCGVLAVLDGMLEWCWWLCVAFYLL